MPGIPKSGLDFVRRCLAKGDLNKCAHHHAHHLVKKAVALEFDGKKTAGTPDVNLVDRANSIGDRSAAVGGEGSEVVFADERARHRRHNNVIKRDSATNAQRMIRISGGRRPFNADRHRSAP